ncbi:MAG: cytochrome P450, partial [Myxococcales bacterium]|nr:cytochrome P450 [Myxococcales bacterium]
MHPLAQTTREFLEEMVRNSSATLRRPPPGRGRAPGPRIHTVGGALGPITTDLMGSLEGYWRDYGDVVRLRFMAATAHLVSDPEAIGHVLQENHRSYSKRSRGLYMLRLILGNGLLTSDGEFWLRQRRIAQPSFAKRRIEGFAQTMVAEAEDVATAWRAAGSHSTDLTRAMSQLTLQVISKCAFGASLKSQAGEIYDAVHFTTEDAHHRVNELFGAFVQPPTRRNQAFRHHAGTLDRIVYGLIEARRRGGPTDDLLGMLLEARDTDTGEGMTDKQLR